LENNPGIALGVKTPLVGSSPMMSAVKRIAARIAARRSTVIILGETGTGKEMLARYIHEHSPRAAKPFVPVDCSSLSEGLFESELFGHVKGAFTGATRDSLGFIRAADGGTLFLDEIGNLSLPLQAKLLRVLQEKRVVPVGDSRPRPVDVRVIAATNANLSELAQRGRFRQDLLFRLSVMVLELPPLRDRPEDILPLAQHFLDLQAELYGETAKTISPAVSQVLQCYAWPGNVRDLANVMEHAHVLATGETIELSDIPPRLLAPVRSGAVAEASGLRLEEVERRTIAEALKKANYNKAAAARLLGINVQRLRRLIGRLEIPLL
jgi:transcriptional regulator with PAS, ATPase and Fis domain